MPVAAVVGAEVLRALAATALGAPAAAVVALPQVAAIPDEAPDDARTAENGEDVKKGLEQKMRRRMWETRDKRVQKRF
jgi:hypothetical protein